MPSLNKTLFLLIFTLIIINIYLLLSKLRILVNQFIFGGLIVIIGLGPQIARLVGGELSSGIEVQNPMTVNMWFEVPEATAAKNNWDSEPSYALACFYAIKPNYRRQHDI